MKVGILVILHDCFDRQCLQLSLGKISQGFVSSVMRFSSMMGSINESATMVEKNGSI
jgi:hypothetical protein